MRWSTVYYCSIEYWFRCMDLDGDRVISMYEMEYCSIEYWFRCMDLDGDGRDGILFIIVV